jgi:hypothetical protein
MSITQEITIQHGGLYIFVDDEIQKDKNNNISVRNTQIEVLNEAALKNKVRDGIMKWGTLQRIIDENKKYIGPHDDELIRRALTNLKK